MATTAGRAGLGTLLRHVLELLEGDVVGFLADIGLPDYRPRYSPVVRALLACGPSSIGELAREIGVTHSAASQTVAQMSRAGLVTLAPGADARRRIVSLTGKTREILPLIEAEWAATSAAVDQLEAELPHSLWALLDTVAGTLERKTFRERIGETEQAKELLARDR